MDGSSSTIPRREFSTVASPSLACDAAAAAAAAVSSVGLDQTDMLGSRSEKWPAMWAGRGTTAGQGELLRLKNDDGVSWRGCAVRGAYRADTDA